MDVGFSICVRKKLSTQFPSVCVVFFVTVFFAVNIVTTLTSVGMLLAQLFQHKDCNDLAISSHGLKLQG